MAARLLLPLPASPICSCTKDNCHCTTKPAGLCHLDGRPSPYLPWPFSCRRRAAARATPSTSPNLPKSSLALKQPSGCRFQGRRPPCHTIPKPPKPTRDGFMWICSGLTAMKGV